MGWGGNWRRIGRLRANGYQLSSSWHRVPIDRRRRRRRRWWELRVSSYNVVAHFTHFMLQRNRSGTVYDKTVKWQNRAGSINVHSWNINQLVAFKPSIEQRVIHVWSSCCLDFVHEVHISNKTSHKFLGNINECLHTIKLMNLIC